MDASSKVSDLAPVVLGYSLLVQELLSPSNQGVRKLVETFPHLLAHVSLEDEVFHGISNA